MSDDRVFFDTNILVYCFDQQDERKREVAHALVLEAGAQGQGVVSYQVQQEFTSVTIRKLREASKVRRMLGGYEQLSFGLRTIPSSEGLFRRAMDLWERYSLAWYDSLIIAAALEGRCEVLYSEDLQDGLEVDGMRVVNPFRA